MLFIFYKLYTSLITFFLTFFFPQADYGLDIKKLRGWRSEQERQKMKTEEYLQEFALNNMKGNLINLKRYILKNKIN